MIMTQNLSKIMFFGGLLLLSLLLICPVECSTDNITMKNNDHEMLNTTSIHYFISIDPVENHTIGDIFSIHGTTNLPVGTPLTVRVRSSMFFPGRNDDYSGNITITPYLNNTNSWFLFLNTTLYPSDEYWINLEAPEEYTTESGNWVLGNAIFILKEKTNKTSNSSSITSRQVITINPVGAPVEGENITLTGTTNLPVGEELFVIINPLDAPTGGLNRTGKYGFTTIQPGQSGSNTWNYTFSTSDFMPKTYVAIVASRKEACSSEIQFQITQNNMTIPPTPNPSLTHPTPLSSVTTLIALGFCEIVVSIAIYRIQKRQS
jgi:hypothetical protein